MSDVPQQAGPDLHAIFGIDGAARGDVDRVISVERAGRGDPNGGEAEPSVEVRMDADHVVIDRGELALDPLPGADVAFETIAGADPYIEVEPTIESADA